MSTNGDIDSSVLLPELDLDFTSLDDVEYNIPKVDKPPTLEDILNDESSLISQEELPNYLPNELLPAHIEENFETGSVSSVGSRGHHSPSYRKTSPSENILQHVVLRAVSSRLLEAAESTEGGWPSVVAVGGVVGVGTRHGAVLCFDLSQRLRWTHDTPTERAQGSVSCLALNADSTRLLAGYVRGLVLMFDSQDGRLLRTISPDSHTPFTAVVHLKFTDLLSVALLSDSGGSVFELGLKRLLGVRSYDSRCIFSGSRGEVVAIEPLLLYNLPNHPLYGHVIVALAALSKVLIVVIRPVVKVVYSQSTQSPPTTLPLLSWQCVIIKAPDSSRVMDPVLAYARHTSISFFQVSLVSGEVGVVPLQVIELSYSLLACHWLTPRTLGLLDSTETLHLLDVRSNHDLETMDMSSIALVYNSSAFKAIATGGNVSKAMALAGQRACYNSVQSSGSQLLLLGKKSLHVISIRLWVDRINNLVNQNRYSDALNLGMDFYNERGKAVLGLKGPREHRQRLVKEKMLETLVKFIEYVQTVPDITNYSEAISSIVEFCLDLNQRPLLFENLWNGLVTIEEAKKAYLEAIESAILDGKLIEVPPEVMQHLVNMLQSKKQWKVLEEIIQRVEVTCLDIEQVMLVCKLNSLYNALISVWNRAMCDYTSPLLELIPLLQPLIKDSADGGRSLGNLLLVYVSSCLGGRGGLESGNPSTEKIEQARQQVSRALCSQHSKQASETETPFPFIRTLLTYNSQHFMNALVISFSDPGLTLHVKQRIVDILIQVMTDNSTFKCTEVALVLDMLSGPSGRGIRVDPELYDWTLDNLVTDTETPHQEKEVALLRLLKSDSEHPYRFQRGHILDLAKQANFHQVCTMVYEEMGEHGNVFRCHLLDPSWRQNIFSFIEHSEHKQEYTEAILDRIEDLAEINSERLGQVLVRHFPDMIHDVISKLSESHQYGFLEGMMSEGELDSEMMTCYVCLMCKQEPGKVYSIVRNHENIELNPAIAASRECGLNEVTAVLLERSGDLQGAFDLLLSRLQNSIENGEEVNGQTEELVRLAQRGNSVLDSNKSWLPLLTCLLKLNSYDVLQRLLSNAELNLVSELHLLMQHTQGTLGDLFTLVMGLFVKCKQERQKQEVLMRLHYNDLHYELCEAISVANRGTIVPYCCTQCSQPFESQLCLFRCGHGYHVDCIQSNSKCNECFKCDQS